MRRLLYASEEKLQELMQQQETQLVISALSVNIQFSSWLLDLFRDIVTRKNNRIEVFKRKYERKYNLEIITKDDITENMKFPINHPVDGGVYANSDINPNYYCPIANYHEYLQDLKKNDFLKLCSSLGAKSIKLVSECNIDKDLSSKNKISFFREQQIDASFGISHKTNELNSVEYTFEKNISSIYEYNSPWFNEEPSWKTMQEMRLENNLLHQRVSYSYYDDFGINAGFAAKMIQIGATLGGDFHNINRIQKIYEIDFWPQSEKK